MEIQTGLLIHPEELDGHWVDVILANKVDLVGLHPAGGKREATRASLEALVALHRDGDFCRRLERLKAAGVQIEYAFHGMSFLLPDTLFSKYPHWFRMNEEGQRVADCNFCPSQPEALKRLEDAVYLLSGVLTPTDHRYHIWQDDVAEGACHCPRCRELCRFDQALLINNAILRGLKRRDPLAKQSHLVYLDSFGFPEYVFPAPGLFLEFAPMKRSFDKAISDESSSVNREHCEHIEPLLLFFGREDATVLEYWMDNSLFSKWKKPPVKLPLEKAVLREDAAFYRKKGFPYLTSFACFLGEDYRALHGEPPVKEFIDILKGEKDTD